MSDILLSILNKAIQNNINIIDADITEAFASEYEANALDKQIGWDDPDSSAHRDDPNGRTNEHLARTRFPCGGKGQPTRFPVSTDVPWQEIQADSKDPNKCTYKIVKPWTPLEVWRALRRNIKPLVTRYSGAKYTKSDKASGPNDDVMQTAALALFQLIDSERDRGGFYIPWAIQNIQGIMRAGFIGTGADKNAKGYLNKLHEASKPSQVDELIAKIDSQDRETTTPRKESHGNQYGKHAPVLYRISLAVRAVLEKLEPLRSIKNKTAEDKEQIEQLGDDLDTVRDQVLAINDSIDQYGAILGARSGLYDVISSPPKMPIGQQYLSEIMQTKNMRQVYNVYQRFEEKKTPIPDEIAELVQGLYMAYRDKDKLAVDDWRAKIKQYYENTYGSLIKAKTAHAPMDLPTPSGKMEPHPGLPQVPDFADLLADKEANRDVVNKILDAGWRGIEVDGQEVKFSTLEFRTLIRVFGIADYPGRGTGKDVELDNEEYKRMYDALMKTITDEVIFNPEKAVELAVVVNVVSNKESELFADITARTIAGAISVSTNDDEEHEITKEFDAELYGDTYDDLMLFKSDKIAHLVVPNESTADAMARHLAMSRWVRLGCPAWDDLGDRGKIESDLFRAHIAHRKSGSKKKFKAPDLKEVFKNVFGEIVRDDRKPDPNDPKETAKNIRTKSKVTFDKSSKMAKIVRELRDELGLVGDRYNIDLEPTTEDVMAVVALIEGAMLKLKNAAKYFYESAEHGSIEKTIISEAHDGIRCTLARIVGWTS